jgi:hypothetical protein
MEQQVEQPSTATPEQEAFVKANAMLQHQASHVMKRLQRCPGLSTALVDSQIKEWLPEGWSGTSTNLVDSLMGLDVQILQDVMQEICSVFIEAREREPDTQQCAQMAQATVALYLLCVCVMIRVQSSPHLSVIPRLESDHAANLFASLIATVMAGGKLELRIDQDRTKLVPKGTYAIQWRGMPGDVSPSSFGEGLTISHADQFERELYLAVMRDELLPQEALSVGKLSDQQRARLSKRLRSLRGAGYRKIAMCVVMFVSEQPEGIEAPLLTEHEIPVFWVPHEAMRDLHPEIAYQLLGTQSAEDLIALLEELLRAVRNDMEAVAPTSAHDLQDAQPIEDELRQGLRDLIVSFPTHPQSAQIRQLLEELEHADRGVSPPRRQILTDTKEVMGKFGDIADSGQKVVARVIQLTELLSKLNPF